MKGREDPRLASARTGSKGARNRAMRHQNAPTIATVVLRLVPVDGSASLDASYDSKLGASLMSVGR